MDLSNDSSRAAVNFIRACELFERLFAIALACRGKIAVTRDMVPTTVFGLSVMVRSDGLPTCTKAD